MVAGEVLTGGTFYTSQVELVKVGKVRRLTVLTFFRKEMVLPHEKVKSYCCGEWDWDCARCRCVRAASPPFSAHRMTSRLASAHLCSPTRREQGRRGWRALRFVTLTRGNEESGGLPLLRALSYSTAPMLCSFPLFSIPQEGCCVDVACAHTHTHFCRPLPVQHQNTLCKG